MKTVYYNIHNIINIKIETERPDLIEEYDYHLRNFKTTVVEEKVSLMVIDFKRFLLPENCFTISNNIYGFKNGFFNKKESYAVEFHNETMVLYLEENTLCLTALLEYLLLPLGITFVHGAGVSFRNKGILFPAPPNTGKTLLVSSLIKKEGVRFFGDDYLMVRRDGAMLSYPMDFSIYQYHFKFFKELQGGQEQKKIKRAFFERVLVNLIKDLPIKKEFKKIARFLGYDYLKGGEFLKIPANKLVPMNHFGTSVDLQYIVFLHQYDGSEFSVEKILQKDASKEILGTLFSEWEDTMPFFYILSCFGLLDFSQYTNMIKNVIDGAFNGKEVFRILIPRQISIEKRLSGMNSILEKEIFSRI